ncbi:MAG: FHA domain-containing protein [Candidatus Eremiobacteraeota bacterium]|nr:FHA domain-containing protein [Candidatus Eremiobacteraeota bacterium]
MKANIEVLSGPTDGETFSFKSSFDIGRDKTSNISLPMDRYISRRHARVLLAEPECFLEDLASTNGTFVNNARVHGRIILNNGQIFRVGRTWLQIEW